MELQKTGVAVLAYNETLFGREPTPVVVWVFVHWVPWIARVTRLAEAVAAQPVVWFRPLSRLLVLRTRHFVLFVRLLVRTAQPCVARGGVEANVGLLTKLGD